MALFTGLSMDGLTLLWSYQAAKGKGYKSGNFLVPLIFYFFFVFTSNLLVVQEHKIIISTFFIIFHFFIYLIFPSIFNKLLE